MYNGAPKGNSMNSYRLRSWSLVAACAAVLACGDDDGKSDTPAQTTRATILNSSAAMIAANALSDMPTQDFVVARTRVQASVPRERTTYARQLNIGAGRAAAVVTDPQVTTMRRAAASALGATLDPVMEADVQSTQQSLDALLQQVQLITPGAQSCDALPATKAEACAIAFLILEVRRSEGVLTVADAGSDASAATADAGSDAGASLPVGAISCPTVRDTTGARELTGTLSASDTWSGKILIKNTVYVSDTAKITIAPGTQIYMDTGSAIQFGYTGSPSVFANGTVAQPITFCGRVAEKGYWGTVTVSDGVTADSVFRNVLFAEGGSNDVVLALDGDVTVDNVQVADSGKDGVSAKDFKAGSQYLSVRGSTGYPLVLEQIAALVRIPQGGTFSSNGTNFVVLRFSTIDSDVTVHNLGVPYLQEQNIYQNTGNLVIEPGVEWRLKSDMSIDFAYLDASSVQINGTAAAPIKFMAVDANSHWRNITLENKVSSNSVISYVELSGGGQGETSVLDVLSPIKLDHVTLSKNLTGLHVSTKGLAPGSSALKISETQARPILAELDGVYSLPADSVLTGNTIDQVQIGAGTFTKSGTILDLGVPYYVNSALYSGQTVALTVAAGVRFVIGADVALNLGYYDNTVTLVGTAAKPIKFSGEQALPGFWTGIVLASSTLSNSKIDYVEIDDAGGDMGAALKFDTQISVTNSKFANSAGYGIDTQRAFTAHDYAMGGNTFTGCALGNVNLR
jgi:hypothetical protein